MIEIERKFLVKNDSFKQVAYAKHEIAQGYLNSNPERSVRVRIKNNNGFITVKGISNELGMSRFEWEKEIPIDEAKLLLKLCEKGRIFKTRYEVLNGEFTFEIDVFHEQNEGLIIAEIELKTEMDVFIKPNWLGEEVTNEKKYYNSNICKNPFSTWEK